VSAISGLATSFAVGSTVVTATSGSVSGSTTLTVTPTALESFVITPNPAFAAGVGISTQLTATGTYSDGTTANVTSIANWTSSATQVATVGPTTGLATGVSLGSATIQATIGSLTESVPLVVIGLYALPGNYKTVDNSGMCVVDVTKAINCTFATGINGISGPATFVGALPGCSLSPTCPTGPLPPYVGYGTLVGSNGQANISFSSIVTFANGTLELFDKYNPPPWVCGCSNSPLPWLVLVPVL